MFKSFEQFIQGARRIALSRSEKARVREALVSYMERNPAPVSPARGGSFFMAFAHLSRTGMVAAVLVVALLLQGGISYAAAYALPGDFLYPVKVKVNEEVRVLLAVTPEAKVTLATELAERRLEEAEQLATEGRLDADAQAVIATNFERHAETVRDHVEHFESEDKVELAMEVSSNFETSVRVHETILAKIAEDKTEVKPVVDTLTDAVRARVAVVAQGRERSEMKVAQKTTDRTKNAALGKLKAAEQKIAATRDFIAKNTPEDSAEGGASLEAAETILAEGKAKLDAGAYGEAFALFQRAQRTAENVRVLARANKELKVKVGLTPPELAGGVGGGATMMMSAKAPDDDSRRTIATPAGELVLEYQEGTAILSGSLARSTPCIEWEVETVATKDLPASSVDFRVTKKSTSEVCVQVLGTPQEIRAEIKAAEKAKYIVRFEGTVVFDGTLFHEAEDNPEQKTEGEPTATSSEHSGGMQIEIGL